MLCTNIISAVQLVKLLVTLQHNCCVKTYVNTSVEFHKKNTSSFQIKAFIIHYTKADQKKKKNGLDWLQGALPNRS
jgi:hypothetical protein